MATKNKNYRSIYR